MAHQTIERLRGASHGEDAWGHGLNVGIFTESYKPYVNGVSVSVSSFARQLRENGDTVRIFAPTMPGYSDDEPNIHRYPSVRFHSRFLQYEPEYTLALGRFPGLASLLRGGFGATVYGLNQRPVLDAMLRRVALDVIHTQSPFAMGAEGRRWAKRRRIPLVTTFHTLYTEYTHYTPFIPRWFALPNILRWTRMNCNAADIVIAPTEAARDVLRSWGVHRPVSILATGINTARFRGGNGVAVRAALGIPTDAFVALYAGRVAPEKNIPTLIEAFARVARRSPGAALLFAGGGPDLEATRRRVEAAGLADRVHFAGYVAREDMRNYYAAADALAFPSETETQGLVLCEAMAAGLPFVAVESPGARSVVPNAAERYLIANSAEALSERLTFLEARPEERERLAGVGREAAEAFTETAAAARLRDIYALAMETRRSAPILACPPVESGG